MIHISPIEALGYASYFYALPYGSKLDKLVAMPEIAALRVAGYTPKTTECRGKGQG